MEFSDQIRCYIQSFCKLLYLGTSNHRLAVGKCIEIASGFSMDVYGYNLGEGLWRPGQEKVKDANIDPMEMLNRIINTKLELFTGKRKLFILEHFDLLIENRDPFLLSRLRLVVDSSCNGYSVIITGKTGFVLPEIIHDIPQISQATLTPGDIGDLVRNCQEDLPGMEKQKLVESLAGMTALQCEDLLALCLATRGILDARFIMRERTILLSQQAKRGLELCEPVADLNSVGGLGLLKDWLMKRSRHIHGKGSKRNKGLPQPKGVLLTGPPGCGKSFVVQALAGSWDVNLIRLDPARLFQPFVGETEQNFISAFETARSLAPAILWIDELEKLFAHPGEGSGDGGVVSRVLSLFLDFLQGRRDGVFVCATTNAIGCLPQEILRPGRFDAVFFIDLPNRREREHIMSILLKKYGVTEIIKESEVLLNATEGFSGAEMEQAVIDTLYEAEENPSKLSEFELLRNVKRVVPLARTMKENFDVMREWYRSRARLASMIDRNDKRRREPCPISQR
jgi:hypothetical protein